MLSRIFIKVFIEMLPTIILASIIGVIIIACILLVIYYVIDKV